MDDHNQGDAWIKQAFAGKQWQAGQGLIVCTGETCFTFKFDGNSYFYAADVAFADPLVGYANPGGMMPPPAPVPRQSHGGGETGAPYAPRSSTVWSPNVVYNPGSQPFPHWHGDRHSRARRHVRWWRWWRWWRRLAAAAATSRPLGRRLT